MDVKSAFNNASKAHLGRRMEVLKLEPDLIRWTHSFVTNRQVKIILDGETGQANLVDTGIPQGSPVAPILLVNYPSGIFDKVERAVSGHQWAILCRCTPCMHRRPAHLPTPLTSRPPGALGHCNLIA